MGAGLIGLGARLVSSSLRVRHYQFLFTFQGSTSDEPHHRNAGSLDFFGLSRSGTMLRFGLDWRRTILQFGVTPNVS